MRHKAKWCGRKRSLKEEVKEEEEEEEEVGIRKEGIWGFAGKEADARGARIE